MQAVAVKSYDAKIDSKTEMKALWDDLLKKNTENAANKDEQLLFKKLGDALRKLSADPKYPWLESHEIDALTNR